MTLTETGQRQVHVLGAAGIDDRELSSRRERVVLAALVLEHGRAVSADRLTQALWPGQRVPASAAKVIHGCINRLRSQLGQQAIETTPTGYSLRGDAVSVDAAVFEHGFRRGRELVEIGQWDRAAFILSDALGRWAGGDAYQDLSVVPEAVIESARLNELHAQADELLVEAMLRLGRVPEAIEAATALVEDEPLRERRWLLLAEAAYRAGRQEEAFEALQRCRRVLVEELGVDPTPAVEQLHARMLAHDVSLAGDVASQARAASDECPWPGLGAYDESRAESFFGRSKELASALAILRARGVLAVVGPSGVGKSSLVRAGIAASARADGRRVAVVTPATRSSDVRDVDVVVIDQAEEVFTVLDGSGRADFLAWLEAVDQGTLVVFALRADRVADVASVPQLASLVEEGIFLLGGLSDAGLREAMERPAAQSGLHVEPGLVDLLHRDLEGEPGALPLLSHAMAKTWERREGRTLTVDGYLATGGVRGAVARSAEELYASLTAVQQDTLRGLMMRLVSAGPEGEPVVARVPSRELDGTDERAAVLDLLVGSRLVTADNTSATLAHEALVRAWPRLRSWLEDDVEGRRMLHHLGESARSWALMGRPESELYRGVRLARVVEWSTATKLSFSGAERAFLEASQRRSAAEEASAQETARRQRATNRRLRVLLVGVVATLVVAVTAGGFAAQQTGVARDQSLAADARRAGAKALTIQDPVRSVLLAAAGVRLDPGPQTLTSLEAALMRRPELRASRPVASGALLSRIAQSATSGSVYVADRTHVLRRMDADSLTVLATYSATSAPATVADNPVAVSERAGVVAYAATPVSASPIVLLDPKTLLPVPDQITSFPKRDVVVASLSVSGDGRFLSATLGHPKVVRPNQVDSTSAEAQVWDLTRADRPVVASFPIDGIFGAGRLNHDGTVLFTTMPPQARDVRSGRTLWAYPGDGFGGDVLVRPQGDLVALPEPAADENLILVDARSGRLVARLSGHTDHIHGLAMSSDGRLVAAGGFDGRVLVWDVDTRDLVADIDAGGKRVPGVALSPDGGALWTATADPPEVRAWDLTGEWQYLRRLPEIAGATERLTGAEIYVDVDRSGALTSSIQRRDPTEPDARGATGSHIDLWFTDSDQRTLVTADVEPGAWEGAGAWSPDGQRFAVGYAKGLVSVVDAIDGHSVVARGSGLPGTILSLSYDHGGRHLVATDDSGRVARLDATTLEPRGPVVTLPGRSVRGVVLGDGGRAVVTADVGEPAAFWRMPVRTWFLVDLEAGTVVRKGDTGADEVEAVAVSPDGTRAAFGGRRGDISIIELATGLRARTAVRAVDDGVFNLRFSADGGQLAAGTTSGDAVLLDGSSGLVLARTRAAESFGTIGVGFRTDGSLLIASGEQSLRVWSRSTTRALDFACTLVGRDLTPDEWADEFPGRDQQPVCP